MKNIIKTVSLFTLVLAATTALAHHSAAQFDFRNTVLITGKVQEVRFANPHLRLINRPHIAAHLGNVGFELNNQPPINANIRR